jgi:excisionase family DNA binding protein
MAVSSSINPLAGAENFPPVLTKRQAASYVQSSTRFLEREIRAGRLKALRLSNKFIRIRRSDLDKFLESGSTIGGGK